MYYGSDAGSTNGAIYNNLVYSNAAFGLTLHENAEACIVVNNVFHGNGRGGVDIAGENTHGTMDCIVKNNIVTNNRLNSPIVGTSQSGWAFNVWFASTVGEWADYATANNVVDKNMHFGNENTTANNGYHTNDTGDWPSGTVVFTNEQYIDPDYVDAANGVFTPQATEACGRR